MTQFNFAPAITLPAFSISPESTSTCENWLDFCHETRGYLFTCSAVSLIVPLPVNTSRTSMKMFTLGLSESPASVLTELFPRANKHKDDLSLQEFITALPETIRQNKRDAQDLIGNLME
jgi:hypothetical protein